MKIGKEGGFLLSLEKSTPVAVPLSKGKTATLSDLGKRTGQQEALRRPTLYPQAG